jgi:hypothetical protein
MHEGLIYIVQWTSYSHYIVDRKIQRKRIYIIGAQTYVAIKGDRN